MKCRLSAHRFAARADALLGFVVLHGTAPAQPTFLASTDYLRILSDGANDELSFVVLDESGSGIEEPRQLKMSVDGRPASRAVNVKAEVLGPRAIALTGTPENGRYHLFELNIQSTYSTGFFGTGERFNALNHRGYTIPMKTGRGGP